MLFFLDFKKNKFRALNRGILFIGIGVCIPKLELGTKKKLIFFCFRIRLEITLEEFWEVKK